MEQAPDQGLSFLEKKEDVEKALDSVLENGDEFIVQKHRDKVFVEEHKKNSTQEMGNDLYGFLLKMNTQIKGGEGLMGICFMASVILCTAISMGWLSDIRGVDISLFQSWWVYVLIIFITFMGVLEIEGFLTTNNYRRQRHFILSYIDKCRMDKYRLLALMDGNSELSTLYENFKKDSSYSESF